MHQHSLADNTPCSEVKAELLYGAWRNPWVEANWQLLRALFSPLKSLFSDEEFAEHCRQIHADPPKQGKPIGPNDTLIAAIARAHDATLIAHNSIQFNRVEALLMEIEKWHDNALATSLSSAA